MVDRVGLERMHHVRELHPVPDEKDRHVVSHQIPVPFSRVELDGEAAGVADRLGRAALMDDGREARDDRGLGSRRAEEVGAGQVRDVVGGLEEALGGGAAGVDDALRDALAVELEVVVGGVGVGVGEVALERFLEGECRETKREEDMMKKKDKRMKKKNEKLLLFLSLDRNSRSRASRRGGSPRAGSGLFLLFLRFDFWNPRVGVLRKNRIREKKKIERRRRAEKSNSASSAARPPPPFECFRLSLSGSLFLHRAPLATRVSPHSKKALDVLSLPLLRTQGRRAAEERENGPNRFHRRAGKVVVVVVVVAFFFSFFGHGKKLFSFSHLARPPSTSCCCSTRALRSWWSSKARCGARRGGAMRG